MQIVLNTLLLISAPLILWYLIDRFAEHAESGILESNEQSFPYKLGDNLILNNDGSRHFHGIDILLPKQLPNFFLDGRKGDGRKGPRIYIKPKQRLMLEGDFNKYFQLFVPKGYETLALSILSPDVMGTLIHNAELYDVEINLSHVRIIAKHRIHKDGRTKQELLAVGQKIVDKVSYRLKSWSDVDSQTASKALLLTENDMMSKFGPLYIRSSTIAALLISFIIGGLFDLQAVSLLNSQFVDNHRAGVTELIIGLFVFPGCFIGFLIYGIYYRKKHPMN